MKKLNETYKHCIARLEKITNEFPWEDKDAYCKWLSQTYYFAFQTTRLLSLASARLGKELHDLHYRFIDHAKEEKGHPELLINDLKFLDRKVEDIPEYSSTAALYQSQFYWINFRDPRAFFGYIIMLEGLAAELGTKLYDRIVSAHGKKAGVFMKVHSVEDVGHVQEAMNQIEQFPDFVIPDLTRNLETSTEFYIQMLEEAMQTQRIGSTDKAAAA